MLKFSFQYEFSCYIFKVSEVKGSFYAFVKKPRGKILGENLKNLFGEIKYISERI